MTVDVVVPPVVTPPVVTPPVATPPVVTPPVVDKTPVVGAPAEYTAFTLPEGAKLEGDTLKTFTEFAKGLGLSQENAQKFVDRELAIQKDANEYAAAEVAKQATAWESEGRQDAEIGGAKYDETLGVAKKALETFGSKALQDMLGATPMGKHPEVIRFLAKIGNAIAQDKFVPAGSAAQPDPMKTLYPSMYKTA